MCCSGVDIKSMIAENLRLLRELFPDVFADGELDFDVLAQLLGGSLDEKIEKYGLNWFGKHRARQLALIPSTGTLRPCREKSLDWSDTQNVVIEGDNLEVLKLLQKSYVGKIKLVYIDPPYNTGKDFVYSDNYSDNIRNYLELTGQVDDQNHRLSSNTEASGRLHTNWLNMLYPRLKLSRSLLRHDGVIFVSIDENELPNLRLIMDDIFGTENYISTITVLCNPRGRAQDKHFATTHEYVVCYSRKPLEKGSFEVPKTQDQILKEYRESDDEGRYRLLELRNTHREFGKHNRPNLYYPLYTAPDGTVSVTDDEHRTPVFPDWEDGYEGCWTWGLPKVSAHTSSLCAKKVNKRIKIFVKDRAEGATRMLKTILDDKAYATDKGQKAFNELFDSKEKIFQSPKSPHLIADLISTRTSDDDIVMDFFAGSGTTGHAVMTQNVADGSQRRYILVQLPEPTDREDYSTISDILNERLRLFVNRIKSEQPNHTMDLGFRVFKLDTSNIKAWNPSAPDLKDALSAMLDHINSDRTQEDLLFEVILKLGLELCDPISSRTIADKQVHMVGKGALIACFEEKISYCETETLAEGIKEWYDSIGSPNETTVFFRDSAFEDDVAKTNLESMLKQHRIKTVRSL